MKLLFRKRTKTVGLTTTNTNKTTREDTKIRYETTGKNKNGGQRNTEQNVREDEKN